MNSRRKTARVAGTLYLLASVVGVLRLLYIPGKLFVEGSATATVNNIVAHQWLFRFGIVGDLLAGVLFLFASLALYRLLREVNRELAVVMVILGGLMLTPIFFVNTINDAGALLFARGGDFVSVFPRPQRDALVMVFLHLHQQGVRAEDVFSGLWLLPFGLLVYRSHFLPRILGAWLMAGSVTWLVLCATGLLLPQHEDLVFTIAQPIMLGEVATMLWLVIMGAKEQRVTADEPA